MIQRHFSNYLQNGGIPEYVKFEKTEYLKDLFEGILYRDTVARYKIGNEKALREAVYYFASNIGKEFSYTNLAKTVGLTSPHTIRNYCTYLEQCYLFFFVNRYSHSLKKQLQYQKKCYMIDPSQNRPFGLDSIRTSSPTLSGGLRRCGKERASSLLESTSKSSIFRRILSLQLPLLIILLLFSQKIAAATFEERVIEWGIEQWVIDQIEEEFAPWQDSGISQEQLDSIKQLHGIAGRFTFIKGVFSATPYKAAWTDELKVLVEKVDELWGLPDLDFLICANSDGFIGAVNWPPLKERAPILAPASVDFIEGVVSFIDHTISPREWGWKQWGFFTMIERIDSPWEDKINLAYWRGVISDSLDVNMKDLLTVENWGTTPRTQLCDYSLLHPDIVDAKHTGWSGEMGPCEDLNAAHPPSPWIPYPPQLGYKYLICADGNTTTYPGYQWRLFSNSVVIKHTSHKYSWFYRGLHPWIHYVPVANDFSNLREVVLWCQDHDALCKQIAANAKAFIRKYQSPEMYFKYAYLVLLKYAGLLNH